MTRIVSWNVMYRPYEEQYNSNSVILKKYPNEKIRSIEIINTLLKFFTEDTIFCLQEVTLYIICLLSDIFSKTHNIFFHNVQNDEYLVTVAPKEDTILLKSWSHFTSNGYLLINYKNTQIINCHLKPQQYIKKASIKNLDYLKSLKNDNINTFIIGDFNEHYKNLISKLSDHFTCPFYGKTYKRKLIDHIIFDIQNLQYTTLNIKTDISDHNLIILEINNYF